MGLLRDPVQFTIPEGCQPMASGIPLTAAAVAAGATVADEPDGIHSRAVPPSAPALRRPGQRAPGFWPLAAFFGLFLLFMYGPVITIVVLSFQGPDGGLTFPLRGWSATW
ncbi:MAG: hypothetical protein AB7G13_20160, partial [Lautropia sp.]